MLCLAFGRGFLELEDCNLEVMIALSIHTQVPAPTAGHIEVIQV